MIEVNNLSVVFRSDENFIYALDKVSFKLEKNDFTALVGESGSGKTITSLSMLNLISPEAEITGSILFNGTDILKQNKKYLEEIRGDQIAMIFQDPQASLNPVLTIGEQISEIFVKHRGCNKKKAYADSIELLKNVKINDPEIVIKDYPHQLSGGMKQRVMIAMALALKPDLIIADEPTTSLDVTIQKEILELILGVQKDTNCAVFFITHNLAVVKNICRNVMIMYAGKIVESGSVDDIFNNPLHPYTKGLLKSVPDICSEYGTKLFYMGGFPCDLSDKYFLCRFLERCNIKTDECMNKSPEYKTIGKDHKVLCNLL